MDSGEQFGISFKGRVKNRFGNKGDFVHLSREYGNTNSWGASYIDLVKHYKEHFILYAKTNWPEASLHTEGVPFRVDISLGNWHARQDNQFLS